MLLFPRLRVRRRVADRPVCLRCTQQGNAPGHRRCTPRAGAVRRQLDSTGDLLCPNEAVEKVPDSKIARFSGVCLSLRGARSSNTARSERSIFSSAQRNQGERTFSTALTFALSGAPLFGASALERVVSRHWFRQPLFCRTNWRKPAKAVAGPNRPALRYSADRASCSEHRPDKVSSKPK